MSKAKLACKCKSISDSVLGDGCDICNPEKAKDVAYERIADLEQQLADLRAACEQKQEIINSFDLVDKARREENYKLEQQLVRQEDYYTGDRKRIADLDRQLADMRLAVEEAYFEGRQDMLAITAGGINSDHSWEESSALTTLTEQDK